MDPFLIIGNLTLDDTVPLEGPVVRKAPGGNALYAAAGTRPWRRNLCIVSRVGTDYPSGHLDQLRQAGVDVSGIVRKDVQDFKLWILYEQGGGRQIIRQLSSGSADKLDPLPQDVPKEVNRVRFALLAAMQPTSQKQWLKNLKARGVVVCMDMASHVVLAHPEEYRDKGWWTDVDILLPSIEEVCTLWGDRRLSEILTEIVKKGCRVAGIKLGSLGSIAYDKTLDDKAVYVPAFPLDPVDPTGAGDAYCAGFMAGYAETEDIAEGALWGTISASFVMEDFGGLHALQVDRTRAQVRSDRHRNRVEWIELTHLDEVLAQKSEQKEKDNDFR